MLVNWNPNPSTDDVTGYTLSAAVAPGFKGKVTASCSGPPAVHAPATDTSALFPKLCAGIPYVVTMTAKNGAGTSSASGPSNPTVPLSAQPPSAPLISTVLSRDNGLIVAWSAPGIDSGDALTGYTLTTTAGSSTVKTSAKASKTQLTLTGLTNGTTYSLSLQVVPNGEVS